jgi:hypothetical protein
MTIPQGDYLWCIKLRGWSCRVKRAGGRVETGLGDAGDAFTNFHLHWVYPLVAVGTQLYWPLSLIIYNGTLAYMTEHSLYYGWEKENNLQKESSEPERTKNHEPNNEIENERVCIRVEPSIHMQLEYSHEEKTYMAMMPILLMMYDDELRR